MRLPRALHPGAWWIWALGLATAASRTTNPLLLALVLVVVAQVVAARRGEAPWAKGFRTYLLVGLAVDRHPRRLPDRAGRLVRRPRAVHPPGGAAARRRRRDPHRWARSPSRGCSPRPTTGCAWPRSSSAWAPPTSSPTRSACSRRVPAALHEVGVAVTVVAERRPAAHRERPARPSRPSAAGRGRAPDGARPHGRSCPCSPTPSTDRSSSPPPWTAGATAAPAPWPLPSGPPPACCCSAAWSAPASAPTGCSTAPPHARSACRCSRSGCCCRSSASA